MKNKVLRIFIVFMTLIVLSGIVSAKETLEIKYFTTKFCTSCIKTHKYIEGLIEEFEAENIQVNFTMYEIMDEENEKLLVQYNNYFDIKEDKYKLIPALFFSDVAIVGSEDIEAFAKDAILSVYNNPNGCIEIDIGESSSEVAVPLSVFGIFMAGLIDGINPCSIAMLLFFVSLIFATRGTSVKILFLGISFALGTFVAYLGIGVGLFNFLNFFKGIDVIMRGFYALLFVMGVYLALLNLSDYLNLKNGKEENIKNQLSKNQKKRIHSIIKDAKNSKVIYLTAFATAFVISFLEFFCTGQIYLPVITYMIKLTDSLNYVFLLILYNIGFVIPIIAITVALHLGEEVIDISTILVSKLPFIKLMGVVFFGVVAAYSAHQIMII